MCQWAAEKEGGGFFLNYFVFLGNNLVLLMYMWEGDAHLSASDNTDRSHGTLELELQAAMSCLMCVLRTNLGGSSAKAT